MNELHPFLKMNPWYPYKHWLTTLVLAPILVMMNPLRSFFLEEEYFMRLILWFLVYGFFVSIPTFTIYRIVFNTIRDSNISVTKAKMVFSLTAILGLALTQFAIGGSIHWELMICYSIAVLITGFFYRLTIKELIGAKPRE